MLQDGERRAGHGRYAVPRAGALHVVDDECLAWRQRDRAGPVDGGDALSQTGDAGEIAGLPGSRRHRPRGDRDLRRRAEGDDGNRRVVVEGDAATARVVWQRELVDGAKRDRVAERQRVGRRHRDGHRSAFPIRWRHNGVSSQTTDGSHVPPWAADAANTARMVPGGTISVPSKSSTKACSTIAVVSVPTAKPLERPHVKAVPSVAPPPSRATELP